MKIILLSGKQGSGKTTLQRALLKRLDGVVLMNFADVIYEMHDSCIKILERYTPKRAIVKDGPLLQLLGTEWGRRTLGDNIWVDILREKVNREKYAGTAFVIIGDCRFQNEFDAFPDALKVRLVAPESVRKIRCEGWRENTAHPSEIGLDLYEHKNKFDLTLPTDLMNTENCLKAVLEHLTKDGLDERHFRKETSGES